MALTVLTVLHLLLCQADPKDLEIHQNRGFQNFLLVLESLKAQKDRLILETQMALIILMILYLLLSQ